MRQQTSNFVQRTGDCHQNELCPRPSSSSLGLEAMDIQDLLTKTNSGNQQVTVFADRCAKLTRDASVTTIASREQQPLF